MKKLAASSSVLNCLALWLLMMATSALCQFQNASVLDTNGDPVESGVEYYIQPAETNFSGRFTIINLNLSCPLYVGQVNTNLGQSSLGTPVTFLPYAENNFLAVNHDMRVAFAATTALCGQSMQWMVGETDPTSGRRLIQIGNTFRAGDYSNYFRILPTKFGGIYNMQYCPAQVCANCRLNCGVFGQLLENGRILVALEGNNPIALQFVRA